jgi:hypothetical protein
MAFIRVDKTVDDVLCETHVDYINLWACVHDEGDLYVPTALRSAIMKKVTSLVSLKELLDKYKLPGLSMSYDVEFDKWLSWTASDSVDIYTYPENREEGILYDMWQQSADNQLKPTITITSKGKIIKKPFHEVNEAWLKEMSSLPNGVDTILIETGPEAYFEYERKVTYPE